LQIKKDGFNALIPKAQGICCISGLYGEGAVRGAGLKNESALPNIQKNFLDFDSHVNLRLFAIGSLNPPHQAD